MPFQVFGNICMVFHGNDIMQIINNATSNIVFYIYIYIYVPLHTYLSISVEKILRSRITELNIVCI